jgi:IMP dehydrogenase
VERNRTFKKKKDFNTMSVGLSYDDVLILPKFSEHASRSDADTYSVLVPGVDLKTPIISANMDTVTEWRMADAMARAGGLGVIHRFMSLEDQTEQVRAVSDDSSIVAAAIGIGFDYMDRAEALVDAGATILFLDVAHGHADQALQAVGNLKSLFVSVVAGNVATENGFRDLADAGADAIKVGIGPGAACTTRLVAGVGVPQLSAINNCAGVSQEKGVPIIADGGIKNPGDVCKAIAAGADTVMVGSMFAGCTEAPGEEKDMGDKTYKYYSGMSSREAQKRKREKELGVDYEPEEYRDLRSEGISGWVESKGPAFQVVRDLTYGLQSAMSYVGAFNIPEFRKQAEFVQITNAGLLESAPHGVML